MIQNVVRTINKIETGNVTFEELRYNFRTKTVYVHGMYGGEKYSGSIPIQNIVNNFDELERGAVKKFLRRSVRKIINKSLKPDKEIIDNDVPEIDDVIAGETA